jgi:chemotaxis protein MotC
MAHGDPSARTEVASRFDAIERSIESADPEMWTDEKNLRVAVVYLLCGGAPAGLREMLEAGFVGAPLAPLLEASLRYAEGQDVGAKALADFNPRSLPPVLGGHLALVQGGSLIGVDNKKAVDLLDLARLLLPSSFVEEAALRREIPLLNPMDDYNKINLLASRYGEKYSKSPYAEAFWRQTGPAIVLRADDAAIAKYGPVLRNLTAAARGGVDLGLARRSLLAGNFSKANEWIKLAEQERADATAQKRISVYLAVMKALNEGAGPSALYALNTEGLNLEDADLLHVSSSVLSRSSAVNVKADVTDAATSSGDDSRLVERIKEALASSSALLMRSDVK